MIKAGETYLGDGVYASFDGWYTWLRTPRADGDHLVALAPEVFEALARFVKAIPETAKALPLDGDPPV